MEKDWKRWLFYVDILALVIFAISVTYLAKDAFWAGYYRGLPEINKYGEYLWHMSRDVAFIIGSMLWIIYRLFRCQFLLSRKP